MKWSELLRVFHWGPLVALSIIGTISTCTIMCDLMWWPLTSVGAWVNIITFLTWNLLTLYNFFNAMYIGPGNVPFEWKPKNKEDRKCLQFCTFCEGYKAPRSHHCRKCQRCVMKMDHHCPWINNCVGHFNHASFCYFLFFAPCGCIHATCILIPAMYRALFRPYDDSDGELTLVTLGVYPLIGCIYGLALGIGVTLAVGSLLVIQHYYMLYGTGREPVVMLSIQGFIMCMFSIGLGLGVVIAVGGLFFMQLRSIIKNETGIESWIKSKAEYRDKEEGEEEFVFPYNLGWKRNLKQVFTLCGPMESDGIVWPVREGCHQYTLTVEQIKQKKEKKIRSVLYDIQEEFSGSMCPCNKGCKVYCCPPCTDEPRIKLHTGDKVLVSRWKKHWLYGDKVLDSTTNKDVKRVRGWFPRRCAVEKLPPCQNSTSDSKKED